MTKVIHKLLWVLLLNLNLGDLRPEWSCIEEIDQSLTPRYEFLPRVLIIHGVQPSAASIHVMVLHVFQVWFAQVLAFAVTDTLDVLY